MAKSKLLDKVRADAQASLQDIEANKVIELRRIEQALADQIAKLEREYQLLIERETALILERARSRARLEQRNMLLAAKWRMIDRVLVQAVERFVADKDYPELVLSVVKRFADKESVVTLSKKDAVRFHFDSGVKVGEPADIAGGVVIVRGKTVLDFSVDRILEKVRSKLAQELDKIMFSAALSREV